MFFFSLLILYVFFIQSDIAALYIKVGLKNIGTVFLHTDAQIPDERFLVLINDMLASGLSFFFKITISCFNYWSGSINEILKANQIASLLNLLPPAAGDIPDLFSDEDMDMIVNSIRMELRGLGLIDTRDNCWSFFIERIRRQLKV